MSTPQIFEPIPLGLLLDRVRSLRGQGYRIVQINATTLERTFELTYTFDLDNCLVNLRLQVPRETPRVPSISPIYWAAFLYENEMHDLFGLEVDGMAVDFGGKFYTTAVKYPFGSTKAPTAKPAPAAVPRPEAPTPAAPPASSAPAVPADAP